MTYKVLDSVLDLVCERLGEGLDAVDECHYFVYESFRVVLDVLQVDEQPRGAAGAVAHFGFHIGEFGNELRGAQLVVVVVFVDLVQTFECEFADGHQLIRVYLKQAQNKIFQKVLLKNSSKCIEGNQIFRAE